MTHELSDTVPVNIDGEIRQARIVGREFSSHRDHQEPRWQYHEEAIEEEDNR